MIRIFKNIWMIIWVIGFLIKYKGHFEIFMPKDNFNHNYYIDIEDDGESFYIYTSIQQLIKDIYDY